MPKNLLQDMVKLKSKKTAPENSALGAVETEPKALQTKRNRYKLWTVAIISVIFFVFAISSLFLRAVVTVNPKMQDVVLNENLSAVKDTSADALPFDLIAVSGEEDKNVDTTVEKDVSIQAQGAVVVYNAFSSANQRLDIDTRLVGSNGKIYKTKKQIIVPGMKGNMPGSIEVGIYGSGGGTEYNSGPLDFTILGFKGTPKYSKFYARSKGDITGGFTGKSPTISDSSKASVLADMKTALQVKLLNKAMDQVPSGFVLFKDAVFLNVDSNNIDLATPSNNNTFPVTMNGTLYGIIFNEEKLTNKIAQDSIDGYDGSPVYISNIQDLNFSLKNQGSISFTDLQNIDFNLSGNAKIVWKVDDAKLATDLLGKSKKDFNQILLQYPNIDRADLVVSPFWRTSLPSKTKDIKVIVNYPK